MVAYQDFVALSQSRDSEERGQAAHLAAMAYLNHYGPADEHAALYAALIGFLDDPSVKLYGAEAGGHGIEVENGHAASMTGGRPGVLHGNRTYLLQDADGQILEGHSISAGLDYPGVGPEHSYLHDTRRVTYAPITDKEALDAFQLCTRLEGIIPALESAHGLAQLMKVAPTMHKDETIVLCLSGRGDKDVESVGRYLGMNS